MMAKRMSACASLAVFGLDVVPFRALRIIVVLGFPGTG
jgi:hypothetical protein